MSQQQTVTVMHVPALGRPFQLGMLYDCRSDSLVTGLTLWDKDVIDQATRKMSKRSSKVRVTTKDDLDSKTFHIGASASITLSILSGTIEVKGSAEFFYDTIDSSEHTRVVLHYSSTSNFEQLVISNKMVKEELRDIDQKLATHIVTGILYGADAIFVFDHKKDEKGSNIGVSGKLEAAVKNIPSVEISGSISGSLSQEAKKIADNLSCKFHGDLILDPLPTTYSEALNSYRTLTHKVGAGGVSVPMRVWLLPLSAVQSNAPSFVKQLSDELSARAQHVMEEFENIKREANDLKKRIGAEYRFLGFIQNRIDDVVATIEVRRIWLATGLSELLPKLRGQTSTGETELMNLLEEITAEPFDAEGLRAMLEATEREANTLNHLFSLITDNGKVELAINPGDFNEALLSTQQANILTLEIIATTSNPYLDWMKGITVGIDQSPEWYDKPSIVIKLRDRVQAFINFAEINASKTVKCVATCHKVKSMDGNNRVKITLFSDGENQKDFEIPRRPRNLVVKSYEPGTVTLEWEKPSNAANITAYIVEKICKNGSDPELKEVRLENKEGEKTMTTFDCDSRRSSTYVFTVRAECVIGLCEKSEEVTQKIEKTIVARDSYWYLSTGIAPCKKSN